MYCLVGSSSWLAVKVGLQFLPPFTFAGLRFVAATITLLPIVILSHSRFPRDQASWIAMLSLTAFQITIPFGLQFWAQQYITSGLTAVMFSTTSVFVVILAHFLINDERITGLKAVGEVTSFTGIVIIFWRDIASLQTVQLSLYGEVAMLAAAASAALATVIGKLCANKIDPSVNTFVQLLIGAGVLSAIGLMKESSSVLNLTATAIATILYLAICGTAFAFVALYWLLKKMSATSISLLAFISPIIALLLGWILLGEALNVNTAIGTVLILVGVYLVSKPARRATLQ